MEHTGVLTGSHLDSVLDGGAYDGPLGVASAPWRRSTCSARRGVTPLRPIGVGVFVEEEGSRFGHGLPRAPGWPRERPAAEDASLPEGPGRRVPAGRDGDVRRRAGAVGPARRRRLVRRAARRAGSRPGRPRRVAVGVAQRDRPHGRYRFDFTGEANHAGTTRMEDRRDPMLTYAMTALAANKQARLAGAASHVRASRRAAPTHQRRALARSPRGSTPARSPPTRWTRCSREIERLAQERAGRDGTVADGDGGVGVPGGATSTPTCARLIGRARRACRRSRRWPATTRACSPRRRAHRDAVRAQPDRGLALARRARRDGRLPRRRRRAGRRAHALSTSREPVRRSMTTYWLERAWTGAGPVPRRGASSRSRTAGSPQSATGAARDGATAWRA